MEVTRIQSNSLVTQMRVKFNFTRHYRKLCMILKQSYGAPPDSFSRTTWQGQIYSPTTANLQPKSKHKQGRIETRNRYTNKTVFGAERKQGQQIPSYSYSSGEMGEASKSGRPLRELIAPIFQYRATLVTTLPPATLVAKSILTGKPRPNKSLHPRNKTSPIRHSQLPLATRSQFQNNLNPKPKIFTVGN